MFVLPNCCYKHNSIIVVVVVVVLVLCSTDIAKCLEKQQICQTPEVLSRAGAGAGGGGSGGGCVDDVVVVGNVDTTPAELSEGVKASKSSSREDHSCSSVELSSANDGHRLEDCFEESVKLSGVDEMSGLASPSLKEENNNMECFDSALGEEIVNSYWRRRNFDLALNQTNGSQHQYHHAQQQQQHTQHCSREHEGSQPAIANDSSSDEQQLQRQQLLSEQPFLHRPSSTALLSQLVNSTFPSQTATQTNSSTLRSTDALQHCQAAAAGAGGGVGHHHQVPVPLTPLTMPSAILASDLHEKAAITHNHQSGSAVASNASTPNPLSIHDQPPHLSDDFGLSLEGSHKSMDDHHQHHHQQQQQQQMMAAAAAAHHHGFLPNIPFNFKERGVTGGSGGGAHFRFADDFQLPAGSSSMAGRLGESLIPKSDPMEAKLQEMLRYNMDKYANQALDTLHISRRVRELLSVHNIGQRIFAKYILGLSQGTVSELLSKPKPWDKLTEKGRDSYRKMHAWSCDDSAVMLLKSLIPKKGT